MSFSWLFSLRKKICGFKDVLHRKEGVAHQLRLLKICRGRSCADPTDCNSEKKENFYRINYMEEFNIINYNAVTLSKSIYCAFFGKVWHNQYRRASHVCILFSS